MPPIAARAPSAKCGISESPKLSQGRSRDAYRLSCTVGIWRYCLRAITKSAGHGWMSTVYLRHGHVGDAGTWKWCWTAGMSDLAFLALIVLGHFKMCRATAVPTVGL